MDAVGRATAGLQIPNCVVAVEATATTASSSHFRTTASTSSSSSSSADCCSLRSRIGLAGSGLPRKRTTSSRRSAKFLSILHSSSSSSRSSAKAGRRLSSAAPVSILQEENLFSSIDADDMAAEAPRLLAQCSNMDWRRLVDELHSEALLSVKSLRQKALDLKILEEEMKYWIHDRMAQDVEVPIEGEGSLDDGTGWSYKSAVEELRTQASLQAAQHMARSVDDSFDWEGEAAELHRRVFRYWGAEVPEAMNSQQRLLHAWFRAEGEEMDSTARLVQEALASTAVIEPHDWQLLGRQEEEKASSSSQPEPVFSRGGASETDSTTVDKSYFGLGAALAASFGGVRGASAMDAIGSDPAMSLPSNTESMEAATRAPSWLVPAVLAFPVLSYVAFNVYREKVNPYARVTDWMFSVVALVIVANIILMATIGIRLY